MQRTIPGIHHVTAIAGDPQANVDFYAGLLGLRLVKLTVNYDDPGTYHLYYGDGAGTPGTILTFFPWPGAPRGRRGTGQVGVTSFSVPADALGYWTQRLKAHGVQFSVPTSRFEEQALAFEDPDGLVLELVARAGTDERRAWADGPVPVEHAIRGFHGVTLDEAGYEQTARLLAGAMGFRQVGSDGSRLRYQAGSAGPGSVVDVLVAPNRRPGSVAVGSVHHVAWRTPGDEEQQAWRGDIARLGLDVTPVMDRKYFHSIYFREPGGVLFEIATDPPGFAVDEPPAELGTHLMLPDWLEPRRAQLERILPRLNVPRPGVGAEKAA